MVTMSFFAPNSSISAHFPQIKSMIINEITHFSMDVVDVTARTTCFSFSARTDGFGRRGLYPGILDQIKVRITNGVKFSGYS
jgi:hypothetical protein